jgi:hypothetical protein
MANGDTTVSRLGQINLANDAYALFLKKFAGEVLTSFTTENIMMPLHTVRTISNGKSAQFPVTGTASAKYHTPGQDILDAGNTYLSQIRHGERVITIDNLLLSSTFIARIDEAMNHYDVRSIYSTELGRALAQKFDKTVLQVLIKSASETEAFTGSGTGTILNKGTAVRTGANLAAAIYEAAQTLDEKNIPSDGRYVVVKPAEYYALVQELSAPVKPSPVGSYVNGDVAVVAGIRIYKSNNLPTTNLGAQESGTNTNYNGNFTDTVAVVGHKASVGTVKLLDLAVESEYEITHQGTLMVAKYAMGHGALRPETVVVIKSSNS